MVLLCLSPNTSWAVIGKITEDKGSAEIERSKLPPSIAEEYTHTDPRPNHIEDRTVHNKVFKAIDDFINNRVTGLVNL